MGKMVFILTLLGHPDFQALLQPTVLAAVAGDFVDDAVFLPVTSVHHVLLDASPKEALRDKKTKVRTGVGGGMVDERLHCWNGLLKIKLNYLANTVVLFALVCLFSIWLSSTLLLLLCTLVAFCKYSHALVIQFPTKNP